MEVAIGGVDKRNRVIQATQLEDLLNDRSVDCFCTYFRYPEAFVKHIKEKGSVRGYNGPCFTDYLPVDIDSLDLDKSLDTTKKFLENLKLIHDVDLNVLPIYFSGAKGFHIMIPSKLFSIEPDTKLPEFLKNLVRELLVEGIEVDEKIYDKTRLLRIPNTRHSATGLYKIPLSVEEVFNKSIEEIKELAKKPRYEELWDPECDLNRNLNSLYISISSLNYRPPKNRAKKYEGLINGIITEGDRDNSLTSLAGKFRSMGFEIEDIEPILLTLNDRKCIPPLPGDQVRKIAKSISQYNDSVEPFEAFEPMQVNKGLKEFPLEVYPSKIQHIAREISKTIGCPIDMIAGPMLGVFSTAIGASRDLYVNETWIEPCCLWLALIIRSGKMKTPAFNSVKIPGSEIRKKLALKYLEEMTEYEKEKREHDKQIHKYKEDTSNIYPDKKPEMPKDKVVETNDITTEALTELLHNNPRGLLLFMDELTGFVMSFDQYKGKGSDRQFYLTLHNGRDVTNNRKGKSSVHVFNPRVTIMGGIQPDMLGELQGSFKDKEDGFIARFLPIYPNDFTVIEEIGIIDKSILEDYKTIVNKLYNLELGSDDLGSAKPKLIGLTPEAKKLFEKGRKKIYDETEKLNFPDKLKPSWYKLPGHILRIALILHELAKVCDETDSELIEEETIIKAFKLAEYFKTHIRKMFGNLSVSETDKLVERTRIYIEQKGKRIKPRDIQRANIVKKKSEVENLLKEMMDRGLGEKRDGGKGIEFVLF